MLTYQREALLEYLHTIYWRQPEKTRKKLTAVDLASAAYNAIYEMSNDWCNELATKVMDWYQGRDQIGDMRRKAWQFYEWALEWVPDARNWQGPDTDDQCALIIAHVTFRRLVLHGHTPTYEIPDEALCQEFLDSQRHKPKEVQTDMDLFAAVPWE